MKVASPGSMKAVSWRIISGTARKKASARATQATVLANGAKRPSQPQDGRPTSTTSTASRTRSAATHATSVGMLTAVREVTTAVARTAAKPAPATSPATAAPRRQRLARGQPSG